MAKVKMTGGEYNRFVSSDCWGEDWYWDETLFTLNGIEVEDIGDCADNDEVVILEGTVYKGISHDAEAICALGFARKWMRSQAFATLMVEVPKDQVEAFKADMKAKGLKVVK